MARIPAITTALIWIAFGTSCETNPTDSSLEFSLGLSYQEFDQTPHSGWRALGDEKRYRQAAELIERYLQRHSELDRSQLAILHWHAGQMLAIAGDSEAAMKHMSSARVDPEPPTSPLRWNDYVDATVAFLRNDRAKL